VTSVDFYFNAADPLQVACRLAGKALAQKKRLLIYTPQSETVQRIDRMLWTWPAVAFVPHCPTHDPLAPDTPVLIGAETDTAPPCEVLLNLSAECPPRFERFDRLLEVVGTGEEEKQQARRRYAFYRDRGYKIASHDLAAAGAEVANG
jgi:DNA polymerase-3 subunit chi